MDWTGYVETVVAAMMGVLLILVLVLGVVLFAGAHLPVDRNLWLWPVFALVVGALFAALYEVTGAVLAPATAHFVINGINLHWLGRRGGG